MNKKINCLFCSNEFQPMNSWQKYCSKRCKTTVGIQKAKIKRLKGFDEEKVKWLVHQVNSFESGMDINQHHTSGFTVKIKTEVKERDNYKCQVCNRVTDLEVHHIIPRINGGKHIEDNLITLCHNCHKHIETGNESTALKKCFDNYKKHLPEKEVLL